MVWFEIEITYLTLYLLRGKGLVFNFNTYCLNILPENKQLFNCVKFILNKNVIHGDALTLKTVGDVEEPIIFSEWS